MPDAATGLAPPPVDMDSLPSAKLKEQQSWLTATAPVDTAKPMQTYVNLLHAAPGFVVVGHGSSGKCVAVATVDLDHDATYVRNLCTHADCRGAQWGNEVLAASVRCALDHTEPSRDILIQVDASPRVPRAYVQQLTSWYTRFGFTLVRSPGPDTPYVTLAWPR